MRIMVMLPVVADPRRDRTLTRPHTLLPRAIPRTQWLTTQFDHQCRRLLDRTQTTRHPHGQCLMTAIIPYRLRTMTRDCNLPHGYYPPPLPPTLSTTIHGGPLADDRTPVARYQPSGMPGYAPQDASSAKYECTYCGKGFTRPSSLKIHLNSHTGEKPFVCPVDGCGRSFSVLSNMRRHARVHVAPAAADDEHQQQRSSALAGPSTSSASQWTHHHRRDSSGGASSSSSRRSHSESSEEEDYDYYDRPEKRTRHRRR
ncbi:hypothetical protein HMN09_00764700 [Mycena chlorophos]|uniref:C2H2-type domain-containing protein n=1 Tax=Mycena chlorophos TaxID=658473 RepID=A0A8H6SV85_MYCCL|nr:hypothetical protein HMN09_00764700 [Mycena chlorophos]